MNSGRVDEDRLPLGIVLDAQDAVARGLRLVGDDGELLADDAVQEGRLAGVRAADQRNESRFHVIPARARSFSVSSSSCARGARDAHLADAPALGVDDLHVQAVDVERLADGRHMAEMAQQKSADGLEPFALDRHVQTIRNFIDVGRAAEDERPVAFVDDRLRLDVVLVANLAEDLLDQILERHEARGAAVLVDDDRALNALVLELAQQLADELRLGHEVRRPQSGW